jgi:aldehyde dehydrogenase
MSIRREQIESIVSEVLLQLGASAGDQSSFGGTGDWGVFERLEDAVAAAQEAYRASAPWPCGNRW